MKLNLQKIASFFLLLALAGVAPAQDASVAATLPGLPPTTDAKEIVRRSVEVDHRNWEKAQHYTLQQREVEKQLDKHDRVKSTEMRTYDVNFYYGQEYSRLIQKDDKPLSDKDQKKEDEKLEKFLSKYRKESDSDREKRLAKQKKTAKRAAPFCVMWSMPTTLNFWGKRRSPDSMLM